MAGTVCGAWACALAVNPVTANTDTTPHAVFWKKEESEVMRRTRIGVKELRRPPRGKVGASGGKRLGLESRF